MKTWPTAAISIPCLSCRAVWNHLPNANSSNFCSRPYYLVAFNCIIDKIFYFDNSLWGMIDPEQCTSPTDQSHFSTFISLRGFRVF